MNVDAYFDKKQYKNYATKNLKCCIGILPEIRSN